MKTVKEKIRIMQAFDDGEVIEFTYVDEDSWYITDNPTWNWSCYDYRIKSEPRKRPMTVQEIFNYWKNHRDEIYKISSDEDIITHKAFHLYSTILAVDVESDFIYFIDDSYSAQQVFKYVTREDGSKFEVEK